MHILSLEIGDFRNIQELRISPSSGVNWIVGGNGAGKTSFLESVFLLARGRTFRSTRHGSLVRQGMKTARIVGRLDNEGAQAKIEMTASAGRKMLYENGNRVCRVRDLREWIQVRMIGENPQRLLEADPEVRRLFLDWNLFHVEQGYADLQIAFRKVLSQRNAWLRSGGRGPRVWDEEYLRISDVMTIARRGFVEDLTRVLCVLHDECPYFPKVRVKLASGWPPDKTLAELLVSSFANDVNRGFTRYGPSRADVVVEANGRTGIRSRGQSKILVCLLQIAGYRVCEERGAGPCIWLLDDLPAELDGVGRKELWSMFRRSHGQLFATKRDWNASEGFSSGLDSSRVFHVEQGALISSDTCNC